MRCPFNTQSKWRATPLISKTADNKRDRRSTGELVNWKLGHSEIQIRTQGVEYGQHLQPVLHIQAGPGTFEDDIG